MRVLIVEDDSALRLGLKRTLLSEGWLVDTVENAELALTATLTETYDVAVLDLSLPKRDGLSVLREWRALSQKHAVVILTARDELQDRITGLNSGADDYLTKPFESAELVARIRAIVRRQTGAMSEVLVLGELSFNTDTRELFFNGQRILVTPREAALLELLISSNGSTVPKSRIISAMSSWDSNFSANAVEIYILKLRRKLAHTGVSIITVRGSGYAIEQSKTNHPSPEQKSNGQLGSA
jgi:DNA-binding response OmpR family regulator